MPSSAKPRSWRRNGWHVSGRCIYMCGGGSVFSQLFASIAYAPSCKGWFDKRPKSHFLFVRKEEGWRMNNSVKGQPQNHVQIIEKKQWHSQIQSNRAKWMCECGPSINWAEASLPYYKNHLPQIPFHPFQQISISSPPPRKTDAPFNCSSAA